MTVWICFWAFAASIFYLLLGYPLLLGLRRRVPVLKRFEPKTVTVVLAVRNGEQWLDRKLRNLLGLDYPAELLDVLVVSDGSTDRTEEIAHGWRGARVRLIALPPCGKAAALSAGIAQATGEILFFTDVRQELERGSLRALVACLGDPKVGVVSGELVIREGNSREEASVGLYWKYEKWIRMRESAVDSILGATGCIYAMRRSLAVPLPSGVLLDDVFLPLAAFFKGFRLILEPEAKAYDSPTSLHTEFRRKVRTQAGVYQLLAFYPQLLSPSNRMWSDFLSHKLGRLLLPWLLLGLFGASLALPGAWRGIALVQIACYLLALADPLIPDGFPLKRATSPMRAFVVLVAAAACAISILFVPPERLWRPTHVRKSPENV